MISAQCSPESQNLEAMESELSFFQGAAARI